MGNGQGRFLAVTENQEARLTQSVIWTEAYRDRVQALLEGSPDIPDFKQNKPVRGILLQNIYGGQDGLMTLLGRDQTSLSFMVSLVGVNQFPRTNNQFKLKLSGGTYGDDGRVTWTVIGTTDFINCVCTADAFFEKLLTITDISPDLVSVGLGNPYYHPDLVMYDPLDDSMIAPVLDTDFPGSYLGCWFINFAAPLPGYRTLKLEIDSPTITSLTNIICYQVYDLISTETTVVTDVSYRTQAYPWQVGSIVSCLDYADCGYGIISATARSFSVQ